ncbi:aspartate ammonia-lyase [Streptomyces sp. LARHCF252]
MADNQFRIEHDLLGELPVPEHAYFGIHTLRAVHNFPITGTRIYAYPDLLNGLAAVKQAAALANGDLELLDSGKVAAIVAACEEIRSGKLHDQFVVDVVQGGAGTSTNMNANEVIANRALELLGHERGDYHHLHPLDDVNAGQSTNDAYPTALKVALQMAANRLQGSMADLQGAFQAKAQEFADVVKTGRTQLQDAVPMMLGREFGTYAVMLKEDQRLLAEACSLLREINLGGTAIGTALNAHPRYAALARDHLSIITGLPLSTAPDLIEATQDTGAFVHLSGVLRRIAVKLSKVCNDLRLLSSGPRAGLGEINLPAVQTGSSIMPGKVNPVIPEVVNQIAFKVIGNDVAVTMAAESGQLQLNAFEPLIAHCLLENLSHLHAGCLTLTERCVNGITANRDHLRAVVDNTIGIITALTPHIGYSQASAAAQEALATNSSVADVVRARKLLAPDDLDRILRPENLAHETTAKVIH